MKQNLLIFVTILLINGVFGLPHGESCKFKLTWKKWFWLQKSHAGCWKVKESESRDNYYKRDHHECVEESNKTSSSL